MFRSTTGKQKKKEMQYVNECKSYYKKYIYLGKKVDMLTGPLKLTSEATKLPIQSSLYYLNYVQKVSVITITKLIMSWILFLKKK